MAVLTEVTDEGAVDLRLESQTDQSSNQYKAEIMSAAGRVALAGLNERVIGILQNAPNGSATVPAVATVRVCGVSKLKVGEACSFGRLITATAAGLGEMADAANEFCFACSLDYAGGAANDLILVKLGFCRAHADDSA